MGRTWKRIKDVVDGRYVRVLFVAALWEVVSDSHRPRDQDVQVAQPRPAGSPQQQRLLPSALSHTMTADNAASRGLEETGSSMRAHRSGLHGNARDGAIGIAILSLVLLLLGAAPSTALLGAEDSEFEPVQPFSLPNLDGVDVSLAEHLGNVIILDFWATWCHACTESFPDIHALQATYADRGVVLLIVCLDKDVEEARDYLVENGYPTDNVLYGSLDEARAVMRLLGVDAVTHAMLIDREGYIRFSGHPKRVTAELLEPWLDDQSEPS